MISAPRILIFSFCFAATDFILDFLPKSTTSPNPFAKNLSTAANTSGFVDSGTTMSACLDSAILSNSSKYLLANFDSFPMAGQDLKNSIISFAISKDCELGKTNTLAGNPSGTESDFVLSKNTSIRIAASA
ncbi:hypothetical protein ES707_13043 [subsurface metagenome]